MYDLTGQLLYFVQRRAISSRILQYSDLDQRGPETAEEPGMAAVFFSPAASRMESNQQPERCSNGYAKMDQKIKAN